MREMALLQKKMGKLGYIFSAVMFPIIYLFAFGMGIGPVMNNIHGGYLPFLAKGMLSITFPLPKKVNNHHGYYSLQVQSPCQRQINRLSETSPLKKYILIFPSSFAKVPFHAYILLKNSKSISLLTDKS